MNRVATFIMNVLRPPPARYRISLQLDDVDKLCDPVTTVLGKKQRLQLLGWYYEVITGAAAGEAVTEAYTNCLAAWRAKREQELGAPFADTAAMEAQLQDRVRATVLEGGRLPLVGEEKRMLVPGAMTFDNSQHLGAGGVADGSALPSHRFAAEGAMWTANPVLSALPLLVRVQRDAGNGRWVPAPNQTVHLQCIPPFHDGGDELADVKALRKDVTKGPRAAPVVTVDAGPRSFITNAIGAGGSFDAADPQRYNAHTSRGGKRGAAVLNNLFARLPAAFSSAVDVNASPHAHAVKVVTNANGEAGIRLQPSRFGGDRYRLQAFVDPVDGRATPATGASAVRCETGRICVWRHVLFSRVLIKPVPVLPPATDARGTQMRLTMLGYDTGPIDGDVGPRTRLATQAFQRNNPPIADDGKVGPETGPVLDNATTNYIVANCGRAVGAFDFAYATAQYAQMYCHLDTTGAQATAAVPMTAAYYQAAIQWARSVLSGWQVAFGLTQVYDVPAMFEDIFESPHLFPIRHPAYYNRSKRASAPRAPAGASGNYDNYWRDVSALIYNRGGMLELFLLYVSGNGAPGTAPNAATITRYSSPGLTLVHSLSASPLMRPPNEPGQVQLPPSNGTTGASGWGTQQRACTVWYGVDRYVNWPYQGDGFTKNSMHELGHIQFLRHSRTQVGGLHVNASFREDHDDRDHCLMGYLWGDGEYCGKCHLKLRGWDIAQMPV